jgi:hypothetical protein
MTNTGTSEHRKGLLSVILEMLDMASKSYEVCRKEPFGISIAISELLPA